MIKEVTIKKMIFNEDILKKGTRIEITETDDNTQETNIYNATVVYCRDDKFD